MHPDQTGSIRGAHDITFDQVIHLGQIVDDRITQALRSHAEGEVLMEPATISPYGID
jgi:hypothetical protein